MADSSVASSKERSDMPSKASKIYRLAEEVQRLTSLHLAAEDEDAPSSTWWSAVEQLFVEWHKEGEISKLLATSSLRSEFVRLSEV